MRRVIINALRNGGVSPGSSWATGAVCTARNAGDRLQLSQLLIDEINASHEKPVRSMGDGCCKARSQPSLKS